MNVVVIYFRDLKTCIVQSSINRIRPVPPAYSGEYHVWVVGYIEWQIHPEGEFCIERDRLDAFQHEAVAANVSEITYQLSCSIIHELQIE